MMPTIKGCDTPNPIENIVEKTNKNNWKVRRVVELQAKHPPQRWNMIIFLGMMAFKFLIKEHVG